MTLDGVAERLAAALDLDSGRFAGFAREDRHGGWDHGTGTFPKGSIWRGEGQVLYALVRSLRPRSIADLGTHVGASATHLAAAIDANGLGRLTSVDHGFGNLLLDVGDALRRDGLIDRVVLCSRNPRLLRQARARRFDTGAVDVRVKHVRFYGGALVGYARGRRIIRLPGDLPLPHPGHLVPAHLRPHCRIVIADALAWLRHAPRLDFVFEDLDHDASTTAHVARLVKQRLNPGGLLVCHDALHPRFGAHVRRGLRQAGLTGLVYVRVEASDCGLAIWRKPS
jgi:predicted O-methyltransferase YrrM